MRTLFLLRHAKSSWTDPQLPDFDRPLNARGLQAAPFIGQVMRRRNYIPEVIVSSPAERAKSTSLMVSDVLGPSSQVLFDARIYESSPSTLLEIARYFDGRYLSAMIVGHNPGLEGLLRLLTGVMEPLPTASLAVIELDVDDWSDIGWGAGRIQEIVRPKDELRRDSSR